MLPDDAPALGQAQSGPDTIEVARCDRQGNKRLWAPYDDAGDNVDYESGMYVWTVQNT